MFVLHSALISCGVQKKLTNEDLREMGVGRMFSKGRPLADSPQVTIKIFLGVGKSDEVSFFLLETKKTTFSS